MIRLATCALALTWATSAAAQRADGPYSGILGGGPTVDQAQGLDLRASLYGAYDKNIFVEQSDVDPRLTQSGAGGGATAWLNYQRTADRLRFNLAGSGAARRYSAGSEPLAGLYSANTSLSANLTPKLVGDVSGSGTYSPFYNFAPFVGGTAVNTGLVGPEFGYSAVAQRNVSLDTTAGLTGNFSKGSSISARVNRREVRMLDDSSNTLRTWSAQADFRHNLSRTLALHLGYGEQFADFSFVGDRSYRNETIDVGVDFGDTLSISRRTALSFSTSTGAIRYQNDTRFRLNGSLQLTRGFGRSWAGVIGYNRNTAYEAGFVGPLLNDSANAGIGGQLATRVKWFSGLSATRGTVGFDPRAYTAYGATSRLDVALTRTLGLYGQYGYYRYEMPQGLSAFTILPRFARGSAAMGLTLWLPLINEVSAPKEPKQR